MDIPEPRVSQRRRRIPPRVFDALLVVVVLAVSLLALSASRPDHDDTELAIGAVGALVGSLALIVRRARPLVPLVACAVCDLVVAALDAPPSAPTPFAFYAVARYLPQETSLPAATGAALAGVAAVVIGPSTPGVSIAVTLVVGFALVVASWLLGAYMRSREAYVLSLEERAAWLEDRRSAERREAIVSERSRIARELHDVVAHHVSLMTVQASGASRVVESAPERARDALGEIERTGRDALVEMRRMVGLLRHDGDGDGRAPQPTIADLPILVAEMRAAGLHATLDEFGERRALSAGVELSAYRIVQEALTNVLRHAGHGARVRVALDYGVDELAVEVVDDGRGTGSTVGGRGGLGLVGLRERVALFGGSLEAAPSASGYRVHARLPIAGGVGDGR